MQLPRTADVVVIGAGIAGASAAWALAEQLEVVLLETEPSPGVHATGRSAALLTETTGPPEVRALVAASRSFLIDPPEGFTDHALTGPRGVLWFAGEPEADSLREDAVTWAARTPGIEVLEGDEARRLLPVLRRGVASVAVYEPSALDLDVDGLLQGFLRGFRARCGHLATSAAVTSLHRAGDGWSVATAAGTVTTAVVVDAAGAWADQVAALAGIEPLGLRPLRRTAFMFTPPAHHVVDRWPLVVDAGESFYVRPDAGRLLGSPADETPSEPCDARPDELDVALAVERIEAALDLEVRGMRSTWAGLRTFAADRVPVAGPDPDTPGFVWLAGQGGYGIKTSPALAAVTAAHILGSSWPAALTDRAITPAHLSPTRLRPVPS